MSGLRMEWLFEPFRRVAPRDQWLTVGERQVRVSFVRSERARRYILRLGRNDEARVTVPRRGTFKEALKFAQRQTHWLEKQLAHRKLHPPAPSTWTLGTQILFRGEPAVLERAGSAVRAGTEIVASSGEGDLKPAVEAHFRRLAARELPARVFELAAQYGFHVSRVTVRSQRSRWGSCSRRGHISLNWRLVQTPVSVRDYIILHELAHLRHMNHSQRYWEEVSRLCPGYQEAEGWLKSHPNLLG
jgi:predicted metal-dependent hydrolase